MDGRYGLTRMAATIVRLALLANRGFLAAVALGLILSGPFAPQLRHLLSQSAPGADAIAVAAGVRWTMLLGIVMAIATDRLLVALSAMVASARAGDPFIRRNADRLRRIGWCLLALQSCDLPAHLIARAYPAMGSAAQGGDISITGWLSVLMVFVLARVFVVGAGMREDLDGIV